MFGGVVVAFESAKFCINKFSSADAALVRGIMEAEGVEMLSPSQAAVPADLTGPQ